MCPSTWFGAPPSRDALRPEWYPTSPRSAAGQPSGIDIRTSAGIVIRVSNKLFAAWSSFSRLALVGMIVWVAALAILPAPVAARILLLAPLVIVPRLLALLPDRRWIARLGGWPTFLAALPLLAAFALPASPTAAVFVVPWLVVAVVGALAAVLHGLANLLSILQPRRLADLGLDVALGFWAVGAIFTVIDRLGLDTGFSTTIVLLTATHFHFAGFGLLGLGSLLARRRPWLRAPVAGLIVGIPLTALGFVLVSDAINAVGTVFVGLSGIAVGIGLLTITATGISRWAARAAGMALLIGMPMGIAWSMAILVGASFLDLDTMVRTHGALNATAILLGVAAYHSEAP